MVADDRRPLVLVVDDYRDAREMYAESLRAGGCDVLEAATGEAAIDIARTHLPDLIVMDVSLPGIDGWTATRTIKSDAATSGILVITLTGNARADGRDAALEAGCDGFLVKPCLPEDMLAEVRQLLRARSSPPPRSSASHS